MITIENLNEHLCLDNYGDSPNWVGALVAINPGGKNPTKELVNLLFQLISGEEITIFSSLRANDSYHDWIEQRAISEEDFQKLKEFSNQNWIKLERAYGEFETLSQYTESLQTECGAGSNTKYTNDSSETDFKELLATQSDLLTEFIVWCIDVNYFSGHVFFTSNERSVIFYPYYFENGLGLIAPTEKGNDICSDFLNQSFRFGGYRIIKA